MRRGICLYIAEECRSLLNSFPTTIEHDTDLLQRISYAKSCRVVTEVTNSQPGAKSPLPEHLQLAIAYRLARKQTLAAVIVDLESIATLIDCTESL